MGIRSLPPIWFLLVYFCLPMQASAGTASILNHHHKSALMSYLYVEPYEVRHEVLTPLRDLEKWIEPGLRGDEYIEVDELETLKQRIGEFFLGKNTVHVDGKALKPVLERTSYVEADLQGIRIIEQPQRLEIATTMVGVIITYITGGLPRQVTVDWELFPQQAQEVPAMAIDPAGSRLSFLTPDDNVHTWAGFPGNYHASTVQQILVADTLGKYTIPVGTLICVLIMLPVGWQAWKRRQARRSVIGPAAILLILTSGALFSWVFSPVLTFGQPRVMAGELDDEQSAALLRALLKNLYGAFDFREEQDVYDKLALSLGADLLAQVNLQHRKSFTVHVAGGEQARIKEVDVYQAASQRLGGKPLAYRIHGIWSATGMVGHWGYMHMRRNLYDANITAEDVDGSWKITGLELLDERRVDPSVSIVIREKP